MADRPNQDRKIGTSVVEVGKRRYTKYDPEIALEIIERIADGELLREICDPKAENPTVAKATFLRWVATVPDLAPAYAAAQRISALSFEEEAIADARKIARAPGSPANVSAHVAKMRQLNWSSERRDPSKYSPKMDAKIIVPITINSSLDLGSAPGTGKADAEIPDMYNLKIEEGEFTEVEPVETKEDLKNMIDLGPVVGTDHQPFFEGQQHGKGGRPGGFPRKRVLTPRIPKDKKDDKNAG